MWLGLIKMVISRHFPSAWPKTVAKNKDYFGSADWSLGDTRDILMELNNSRDSDAKLFM